MKSMKRLFAAIFVVVCFGISCKNKSVPATSDKFSLLWEITGNGLKNPSYLFGTIHIYDTGVFEIPKEVFDLANDCDNLALELDVNNIDFVVMSKAMINEYPDSVLDKLLPEKIYRELMTIPMIKLMGNQVDLIKPVYLYSYLMIDDPGSLSSVESVLNDHALSLKKKVIGIETLEEQIEAVDRMPISEQIQGIIDLYDYCDRENMSLAEGGKKILNELLTTYKNQDFETLLSLEEKYKMTSSSGSVDSAMVAERNIRIADRISEHIQQGQSMFSAVGALHLPDYKGMQGVVNLLKEKGYDLRPLSVNLARSEELK